jgi:hypothetical protein
MTFATSIFGLLTLALLLIVLGWAADLFQALHRSTAPRVTSTRATSTAGTRQRPFSLCVERGTDRLPARPDRIADRVLGRLTETGPGCGRTRGREYDIPSLEAYAQRFEEAIEKIRLGRQDSRREK